MQNYINMNKLTVLLFSLLICIGITAQENKGVNFENLTFAQAIAKAKSGNGPNMVFMDCYTEWCGPCKQMDLVIFPQKAAGDYFNANFVNIKKDMEKGEGIDIAQNFIDYAVERIEANEQSQRTLWSVYQA